MKDLIALKPLKYAGKKYTTNDTFSARPRDAKLLVAVGRAAYAQPTEQKQTVTPPPHKIETPPSVDAQAAPTSSATATSVTAAAEPTKKSRKGGTSGKTKTK